MTTITTSILAGAWVGLSIAAPIGPTSMLCIQRTLSSGLRAGLATGCGVATVHFIYGGLSITAGSALFEPSFDATLLSLASSLVLLGFSVQVLRRAVVINDDCDGGLSLPSAFLGALGFGFLNPVTPILFAAATPTLIGTGTAPILVVVAGVFLGSLAWWCTLSMSVALLRRRLTCRAINLVNKAAAVLLAVLALATIVRLW